MNSQFSHLSVYESDSDSAQSESNLETSIKKRSKGILYSLVQTFISEQEKNDFISSSWKCKRKHDTEMGLKEYLYCTIDRKSCSASAYLLYDNRNEEIKLFMGDIEHEHQEATNTSKISDDLKQQIREIYESGVIKTSLILRQLVKKEITPLPKLSQLKNCLVKLKEEIYGKARISLVKLDEWSRSNSGT